MRVSLVKPHGGSHRRLGKALKAGLLLAIAGLPLAALLFHFRDSPDRSLIGAKVIPASPVATNGLELRLDYPLARQVFPYSVVPGGVQTAREAEDAIQADPVVALHYRGLHIGNLLLQRTAAAMDVFVSYRAQNAIYWTSRRIHMAGGELVLVDGTNMIRARCGNRIAFERPRGAPRRPHLEPARRILEGGLPPPFIPGEPLLAKASGERTPDLWPPVFVPLVPCCTEYVGDPVNPIGTTPEPPAFLLVGTGLALWVVRMRVGRRLGCRVPSTITVSLLSPAGFSASADPPAREHR